MDLPVYQYEPLKALDSVRVLIVKPSTEYDAPFDCEIVQNPLLEWLSTTDASQHYEAVSYTWGEPVFSCQIQCQNRTSKLNITPNVDTLLRHLRKSSVPRYLWIDAICLNQDDEAEKSMQIPNMARIYTCAKEVHVWLGTDPGNAKEIFAFFRGLSALPLDEHFNDAVWKLANQKLYRRRREEIEKFLIQPWFSRRWVLQEVAWAKNTVVHYGAEELGWQFLMHGMSKLAQTDHKNLDLSTVSVDTLTIFPNLKPESQDILDLLWDFHASQCSDPRDKLAALYGLRKKGSHELSELNYQATWTDIYIEFASAFALDLGEDSLSQILAHLLAFGPLSARDPKFPAWIPDWSKPRQHLQILNKTPFYSTMKYPRKDILFRYMFGIRPSPWGETQELHLNDVIDDGLIMNFLQAGQNWTETRTNFFKLNESLNKAKDIFSYCSVHNKHHNFEFKAQCVISRMINAIFPDAEIEETEAILRSASVTKLSLSPTEAKLFRRLDKILSTYTLFVTRGHVVGFGPVKIQGSEEVRFFSPRFRFEGTNELCIGFVVSGAKIMDEKFDGQPRSSLLWRGKFIGPYFCTSKGQYNPTISVELA